MKHLSREQVEAFQRLSSNFDFDVFVEWLEESKGDITQRLINEADGTAMHQLQGQAQALQAIMREIYEAKSFKRNTARDRVPVPNVGIGGQR